MGQLQSCLSGQQVCELERDIQLDLASKGLKTVTIRKTAMKLLVAAVAWAGSMQKQALCQPWPLQACTLWHASPTLDSCTEQTKCLL
jgi:hypothetical protein